MLHTISSDALRVHFNDEHGEITAIEFDGLKVLKEPSHGSWPKSWPVMFPICGKLKESRYLLNGQAYEMPGHGFFRSLKWDVHASKDGRLLRCAATNTNDFFSIYPFAFAISLEIAVAADTLFYTIDVTNKSEQTMYYNTGHHGAFLVDPKNHRIELPKPVVFKKHMAAGGTGPDLTDKPVLLASDLDFDSDCSYQAFNSGINRAILHSGKGYCARFSFETFNVFTLWAKPNSDWLCIEPWNGNQDVHNAQPSEISTKPLIRSLQPGMARSDTMIISFSRE